MTNLDKILVNNKKEIILSLHERGFTPKRMASMVNLKANLVECLLKEQGLKPNISIISENDKKIQELYDKKYTDNAIAHELNIRSSAIWRWREGKGYKCNTEEEMINHNKRVPIASNEQLCWYCKKSCDRNLCEWVRTLKEQPDIWEEYEPKTFKEQYFDETLNKLTNREVNTFLIRKCKNFEVAE